jgi:hypothetical protein
MIWMRSPELAKLAAVTAAVAASTTKVIWELVRELESVLLVFLEETLVSLPQLSSRDLEVLDDERLALSSAITEDATLLVSPVLAAPSPLLESLLEHEANINGKNNMVGRKQYFFATSFFKNLILSERHKIFALKDFILDFLIIGLNLK